MAGTRDKSSWKKRARVDESPSRMSPGIKKARTVHRSTSPTEAGSSAPISTDVTPMSKVLYEPPSPLSSSFTDRSPIFHLRGDSSPVASENRKSQTARGRVSLSPQTCRSRWSNEKDDDSTGWESFSEGTISSPRCLELLKVADAVNGNPTCAPRSVHILQIQMLKSEVEKCGAGIRSSNEDTHATMTGTKKMWQAKASMLATVFSCNKKEDVEMQMEKSQQHDDRSQTLISFFLTFPEESQERFYPKKHRAEIDYIIRWTEGELLSKSKIVYQNTKPGRTLCPKQKEDIECMLRMRLDRLLAGGWICGRELTLADIAVFPYILVLQKMFSGIMEMEKMFPLMSTWFYNMLKRTPAYNCADKYTKFPYVGPYDYFVKGDEELLD